MRSGGCIGRHSRRPDRTDAKDVSNSEGQPIGTKKAKAVVAASTESEQVVASINKVFVDVTVNSSMRRAQMDKRWEALLQKADIKLELTKSKVVVLKRKEDFMILTADVSNISPQVKAAYTMFCVDILKELGLGQTPRTATRMEVDDDETQEVDLDETDRKSVV